MQLLLFVVFEIIEIICLDTAGGVENQSEVPRKITKKSDKTVRNTGSGLLKSPDTVEDKNAKGSELTEKHACYKDDILEKVI